MWINFHAKQPFAIKVFAGGINAVSGEGTAENMATMMRRKQKLSQNKTIQDYVVAPKQKWLDGIAKLDGQVMQFVATPENSGYSVEAQMTGSDSVGGLQFEVVPTKYIEKTTVDVIFRDEDMDEVTFRIKLSTPFRKVMEAYCTKQGIPASALRFRYEGNRVNQGKATYKLLVHVTIDKTTDDTANTLGLEDVSRMTWNVSIIVNLH